MHRPPEPLQVGEYFSQKDIEDAFNTGFGYRISGINPRRDSSDNRYMLVFANEDGPYDDSVRQGRFEYIGEGLEGDQSENSPGNSALIDAVSSDFPVYFFYAGTDRPEWEYQGQVDVLGYQSKERGGRKVLVFDMEHQGSSSPEEKPGLYLIPVNDDWREKFRNSVEEPHDLRQYADVPPQIEGIDRIRIWGTTETDGDKKQSAIDKMSPDDCLLFYHDGEFVAGGIVGRTFENPDYGELLWNNPRSRHLFTVENFTHSVPTIEVVWDKVGYEGRQVVQGFTRVADDRVSNIREEHGSLESLILESDSEEPSPEEIEEEKSELAQAVESEPELTEDNTEFVETRRKARDSAFRELVRDTYNNTCAVCGSQRESPDGNPEVEAAHIYPHSKGGSDDIRNGIALCKSHHWAFDSGWIAFTNDHEIIVADAPDKSGFHELKQLERQSLRLPDNEDAHPHPMFLEQHREIQGFD
ncbi:HNH endonuclease [Halorubrum halophilum]|uniref:HNH endonuclease n=1 Tax=Halorubrum halophilum TaxID=413816 RepID=UPI001D00EBD7|nr:HNH endonuclease [Halorubrum halophilum]